MPDFSLRASIQEWNQNSVENGVVSQTALITQQYYLRADWNIFDGLETRGRKQEALLRKRMAERQLERTTDDILSQAQNSQRNVDFAWRALGISDRQFASVESAYRQSQAEFRLGNASQEALEGTRSAYYATEAAHAGARLDFLAAWCDFLSLSGADPALNQLPASYARINP